MHSGSSACELFHYGLFIFKADGTWTAIFTPAYRDWRAQISRRGAEDVLSLASSSTQIVKFSGDPIFALRSTLIPGGPWAEGPFSSKRRTGGVFSVAASSRG